MDFEQSCGVNNVMHCNCMHQGGVLHIYSGANPAISAQMYQSCAISCTNREVSVSSHLQALFGSRSLQDRNDLAAMEELENQITETRGLRFNII